jgi:Tol biopolymer transport system component
MAKYAINRRSLVIPALIILVTLSIFPASHSVDARTQPQHPAVGTTASGCDNPWDIVSSRTFGNRGTALNDVVALSPNNLWAVGYHSITDNPYRQPLIQHWNGTDWAYVPSPSIEPGGVLYGVDAAGPNDIWAAGAAHEVSDAQTLIMHWDGASWSRISSPNTIFTFNALYDIAVVATSDIWAVGDDGGQPIIMHWNGTQWNMVAYPNLGSEFSSLQAVTAISANDIWAVGHRGSGLATTLTMHWNGANWAVVPSPNPSIGAGLLYDVTATGPNDVWAVGAGFYPVVLHWGGTSWQRANTPELEIGDNILLGVAALAPNDVWAVGQRSGDGAIALHWDGASWWNVSPPRTTQDYEQFRAVAAISNRDVWTVGQLYMGSDQGKTLVKHFTPAVSLASVSTTRLADGTGRATVSVALSSTVPQTVTVAYATSNETAFAGIDYVATSGVLKIPPLQCAATFDVPLLKNPAWKPSAIVKLTVRSPVGAVLGTNTSLPANITDYTRAPSKHVAYLPNAGSAAPTIDPGRLAYVASTDPYNWDIWTMNPDGSDRRQLTTHPAHDDNPTWSPDGQRIAFVSERDGNPEIYVMNADGSQQTRLTNQAGMDLMPNWSPDGQRIAFVSDRTRKQLLYVMNVDGSQPIRITNATSFDPKDASPAWSPDGQRIAFSSQRSGHFEIYMMEPSGGALQQITSNSFPSAGPVWSPDGQWIAINALMPGYVNIALIRPDGSQYQFLNENFDTGGPAWSPDGKRMTFDYLAAIYVMNISGGQPTQLPRLAKAEWDPDWQPQQP